MSDIVMKHYGIKTDVDIVERLRDWQKYLAPANSIDIDILTREAAAEIERLRHPKIVVGSRELWEAMGLVVARSDALEEAAKVVEEYYQSVPGLNWNDDGYHRKAAGDAIAKDIRALKEKAGG